MTVSSAPGSLRVEDPREVMRGLAFVIVSMIVLPAQDTIAKFLSTDVSPGTVTWARFFLQTCFTLPFLLYFQGVRGLVSRRLGLNAIRGVLIALAAMFYFASLKVMPIADAMAIFFVEPFILTVLSALVDKEQVGWRRRIAVVVGFIGVLIVVQPSWTVFGPISIIPGLGGALFAVYALMNRRVSAHDTPLTMQFVAGLAATGVLTVILLLGGLAGIADISPTLPGPGQVLLLLLMGAFGTSGHLLFVQASRLAPSSLIAAMQYVEIVCAAIYGYIVFGDFPTPVKWLGIAIIMASGAYVFWRESRVRQSRRVAA